MKKRIGILLTVILVLPVTAQAAQLLAGAAKVDITDERGPVNDRLYARALVLKSGDTVALLVTVDDVSFGEIGYIKNDYLPNVRSKIQKESGIPPGNTIFNASHCHGIVHPDIEARTVEAVKAAALEEEMCTFTHILLTLLTLLTLLLTFTEFTDSASDIY